MNLPELFLHLCQIFAHSLVTINQLLHQLELLVRQVLLGSTDLLFLIGVQSLFPVTHPAISVFYVFEAATNTCIAFEYAEADLFGFFDS